MERFPQGDIVSGSRFLSLGRRYYVKVVKDDSIKKAKVVFNHSKFTIYVNPELLNNADEIIINFDAVKLPFAQIDYIVVHELCHIRHKDHSKEAYQGLAKFISDWKTLDERLCGMR